MRDKRLGGWRRKWRKGETEKYLNGVNEKVPKEEILVGFPGDRRTPAEKETCRATDGGNENRSGWGRGEGNVCLRERVAATEEVFVGWEDEGGKVRKVSGVKM